MLILSPKWPITNKFWFLCG